MLSASLGGGQAREPMRTELALAQAFNCGLGFRRRIARYFFDRKLGHYAEYDIGAAGYHLERLQGWIGDGSATCFGLAFPVVLLIVQLVLAVNAGFLFAHPWAPTSSGQFTQLGVNLLLQLFCALFTACGVPL